MIPYVLFICLTVVCATSPPMPPTPSPPEPSSCPHDESFHGFDMEKMLGKWYVAAVSTTTPREIRGNIKPISGQTITITKDSGHYHLTHSFGKIRTYVHEYKIVQEDRKIDTYTPEQVNELKFTVVNTDYDNVALLITCAQSYSADSTARVLVRKHSEEVPKYLNQMYQYLPQNRFHKDDMETVEV